LFINSYKFGLFCAIRGKPGHKSTRANSTGFAATTNVTANDPGFLAKISEESAARTKEGVVNDGSQTRT